MVKEEDVGTFRNFTGAVFTPRTITCWENLGNPINTSGLSVFIEMKMNVYVNNSFPYGVLCSRCYHIPSLTFTQLKRGLSPLSTKENMHMSSGSESFLPACLNSIHH